MSRKTIPTSYCPHCNHETYDIFGTCFVCKRDKGRKVDAALLNVDQALLGAAVDATAIEAAGISQELEERGLIKPTEEEKRDAGIEAASAAAPASWNAEARIALREVATEKEHLTSDDVWDRLKEKGVIPTERPNAMAGIIRWGWRGDPFHSRPPIIAAADKPPERSRGENRHRGRIMVWRSLIYAK